MPRIQQAYLLTLVIAALVGCSKPVPPEPSPAQFLHDIDSMNAWSKAEDDRKKNRPNDPKAPGSAAYSAVNMAFSVGGVGKCWPKKQEPTTATTDHDCLEKLGYKRP